MEDERLFTFFYFFHGRRAFFLGSTPFRRGGSPAPFWFPYFGGVQEQ